MTKPSFFQKLRAAIATFGFKQWFLLILNTVLVLACIGSALGLRAVGGMLETVTAADRFRGESETSFAQVACFFSVGQGKGEEDIYAFRQKLDTAFVEQSLETPENGSLYLDAYCGSTSVSINTDSAAAAVEAVGVGGNFFYFHPLRLRSGAYISESDLMDDLVLLDEEMAWRLFGGMDLTGMTLHINGKPFVVSGVVEREKDFATEKAYTGQGGIFMSYSALKRLVEDTTISCYEIVMPDPISGYAMDLVKRTFPVDDAWDMVENSSRYELGHLLDVIGDFGQRSMRTNGVIYPYWENALRLTEDYAALLLILTVLFALCPLVFLTVITVNYIRRGYRFVKTTVPERVETMVEQSRERRLEQEYEKKTEVE